MDYDVVIVGAGPVGLISANLLGQYGLKTLIIEKESHPYTYPRAITIDDEALRNLQLIGFTQREIEDLCITPKMEYFSLYGYRSFTPDIKIKPYGYPILFTYLQPDLEKMLREKLSRFPSVTFIESCEFLNFEQNVKGIKCKILKNSKEEWLSCTYLLGCDGAKSTVRKSAGIKLQVVGNSLEESWLVVDLYDSREIMENISKYSENPTHERPSFTANLPKGLRRFEVRFDDKPPTRSDATESEVMDVLKPFLINTKPNIIRGRLFGRYYRIVDHFNSNRVFVVGDAAHLVPPYGGQGLCSGIRDATNICWKIALMKAIGPRENLIASYDTERRTHLMQTINFIKSVILNLEDHPESGLNKNITNEYYRKLKPQPRYPKGVVLSSKYAGELLPQPEIITNDGKKVLLDDLLGIHFAIITVNSSPEEILNKESMDFWKEIGCRFVNLNAKELAEQTSIFSDPDQDTFIVRPDRFILASCKKSEINSMTKKFKDYLSL